jgi:hypothetical protein
MDVGGRRFVSSVSRYGAWQDSLEESDIRCTYGPDVLTSTDKQAGLPTP